jgi:hypothetical protein
MMHIFLASKLGRAIAGGVALLAALLAAVSAIRRGAVKDERQRVKDLDHEKADDIRKRVDAVKRRDVHPIKYRD